ncbi:MAG TPA: hypothetical protein VKA24_14015 [Gaiellaceae bacterium]|nr:hypothetical protein [Gaiellaceae bacterium]
MPRLRPRSEKAAEPTLPTEAICMEAHRPWAISDYIEKGTRLSVSHPAVRANPSYFAGIVPLPRDNREVA